MHSYKKCRYTIFVFEINNCIHCILYDGAGCDVELLLIVYLWRWFGTMGGVNGPVVLLEIDKSMHKSSVVNFLWDNYGLHQGSFVIMNKNSYVNDVTWTRGVGVLGPRIIKTTVSSVSLIFICYYTLLTPHPPCSGSNWYPQCRELLWHWPCLLEPSHGRK